MKRSSMVSAVDKSQIDSDMQKIDQFLQNELNAIKQSSQESSPGIIVSKQRNSRPHFDRYYVTKSFDATASQKQQKLRNEKFNPVPEESFGTPATTKLNFLAVKDPS